MESFPIVFVCAAVVGLYALRYWAGWPSHHTLLPFQAGILYRRGRPLRELGPGRHRVFLGIEKIIFLDKRPINVNVDRRAVLLADGGTAIYSFAASAELRDVRKAIYASATYSQLPAFVTLCVVRARISECTSSGFRGVEAALMEEMTAKCRSRLEAAGFELLSLRLTSLEIRSPASA
jgi:hypothetical protein